MSERSCQERSTSSTGVFLICRASFRLSRTVSFRWRLMYSKWTHVYTSQSLVKVKIGFVGHLNQLLPNVWVQERIEAVRWTYLYWIKHLSILQCPYKLLYCGIYRRCLLVLRCIILFLSTCSRQHDDNCSTALLC